MLVDNTGHAHGNVHASAVIQFYPLPRPWMPRLGENFPRCLAASPWEAAPMAQIDTFDMMTSAQQLPIEHFADYSFVF